MKLNHLVNVHAVDVIGAEDRYYVGAVMVYQPQVLIDGVSGALEPVRAAAHLGWNNSNKVIRNDVRNRPCTAYVLDQGLGFVLDQQIDRVDFGINQIAEHKIDDAVTPAERNCRL